MRALERLLISGTVQKLAARLKFFRLDPPLSATAAKRAALRVHASLVQSVLSHYAIDCVLDVGANQGQFAIGLRADGYRGAIISFEPGRDAFEALRHNAHADPDWHFRPDALGAREEIRTFHIMRRSEFSSLLTPSPDQPGISAGRNKVVRTETVTVRRLDSLAAEIPALAQSRRLLLKMDSQGADLDCLRRRRRSPGPRCRPSDRTFHGRALPGYAALHRRPRSVRSCRIFPLLPCSCGARSPHPGRHRV